MKYRQKNSFHKKFVAIVLAFLLISTFSPIIENMIYAASSVTIGTKPSAVASSKLYGKGTSASPYEIYKYEDLLLMEYKINNDDTNYNSTSTYYTLMNNINCSYAIRPIGSSTSPFKAELDGNGFTITYTKLYFSGTVDNLSLGLFGYNQGTIKNLTVKGSLSVACTKSINNFYLGGICGYNMGTIENCTSDKTILITDSRSNTYLGGIVGFSEKSLYNCTNKNTISCSSNNVSNSNKLTYNVGGISGHSQIGLYNCFNYGSILGKSASETYVGGISGYITFGQNISTCFSKGTITSLGLKEAYAGGIIGGSNYSYTSVIKISDCYNENNITSGTTASNTETTYAGGLIGYCYDFDIWNTYNTGDISSYSSKDNNCYAGGIVGMSYKGKIKNSYSTGTVDGNGYDLLEQLDIWKIPYQLEMINNGDDDRYWYCSYVYNYPGSIYDGLMECEYSNYVRTFNPIIGHSQQQINYSGTVKYISETVHDASFKELNLSLTMTQTSGYYHKSCNELQFSLSVTCANKDVYTITVKNNKNTTIYSNSFTTMKDIDAITVKDDMPTITFDYYQYQHCVNLNHYPDDDSDGNGLKDYYFWQNTEKYALKYTSTAVQLGFYCKLEGGRRLGRGNGAHISKFYSWDFDYPDSWHYDIDAKMIFPPIADMTGSIKRGRYPLMEPNSNVHYSYEGKTTIEKICYFDFGIGFSYAYSLPKLRAFNW